MGEPILINIVIVDIAFGVRCGDGLRFNEIIGIIVISFDGAVKKSLGLDSPRLIIVIRICSTTFNAVFISAVLIPVAYGDEGAFWLVLLNSGCLVDRAIVVKEFHIITA